MKSGPARGGTADGAPGCTTTVTPRCVDPRIGHPTRGGPDQERERLTLVIGA